MAWHVAKSLEVLRLHINALAPRRSKVSDGAIGDAAHASRDSDHNPWYRSTVTARDFTHDPAGGFDAYAFAETLRLNRDPRIKYVISNGRIFAGNGGPSPWVWRAYGGRNRHDHHTHVSLVASPACESAAPWDLVRHTPRPAPKPSRGTTRPPVVKPPVHTAPRPSKVPAFPGVTRQTRSLHWSKATLTFQRRLKARGWDVATDGKHGPRTTAVLKAFQHQKHLTADGVGGPKTWAALWTSSITAA